MDKDIIRGILAERTIRSGFPTQQEIANFLGKYFPEETEEQKLFHDHWGLYSKTPDKVVKRILLCTTPTSSIVDYFKKTGYDLLISHHDMLSNNNVPQIIYHSTMDINQKGHNMYFVRKMGLRNFRQLHAVAVEGDLYKPLTLDEFKAYLEKHGFEINGLVWENENADNKIQSVMYCSGMGGYLIGKNHIVDVSKHTADVYVTGELMAHPNNTPNQFKYIIELGHTSSEKPIFKWVKTRLANRWQNLEIDLAPKDIDLWGDESYKNKENEKRRKEWEKEWKDKPQIGFNRPPFGIEPESEFELVNVLRDKYKFTEDPLEGIEYMMRELFNYAFTEDDVEEIIRDIEIIIYDIDPIVLDEVQPIIDQIRFDIEEMKEDFM
jgi:putative NIF3 family GTP cyclohydrolase 1 type 2